MAIKENIKENIKEKWNEYVQANGCEPVYADCRVQFKHEDNGMDVNIKLLDELDDKDNLIFYYTSGLNDLLSLCEEGIEDFVITDFYGFCDTL